MTLQEQLAFLQEHRTISLCTLDKDGYPHVVAMNYLAQHDRIYMATYRKSQKVVNIRRNPKVALFLESGGFSRPRGLMIRGVCEIVEEPSEVLRIISALVQLEGDGLPPLSSQIEKARPDKRVVLKVKPHNFVSWDFRKLDKPVTQ